MLAFEKYECLSMLVHVSEKLCSYTRDAEISEDKKSVWKGAAVCAYAANGGRNQQWELEVVGQAGELNVVSSARLIMRVVVRIRMLDDQQTRPRFHEILR